MAGIAPGISMRIWFAGFIIRAVVFTGLFEIPILAINIENFGRVSNWLVGDIIITEQIRHFA